MIRSRRRLAARGPAPLAESTRAASTRAASTLAVVTLVTLLGLTGLGPAAAPAEAAPVRPRPTALELRVDDMFPRVVTATGPTTLTITGELTNTGDQPVTDVKIRPQRGDRLRTDGDLRNALGGTAPTDTVAPAFTELTDELGPGERTPVRVTVPLRGSETSTLALQRTGVYELLINVNGVPEDGGQARLGAVRLLLPVLGLPTGATAAPATTAVTGAASPITVLYPLADRPHRLPTGPGEQVLLGDDELAAALAAGGRLDGLLDALETAAPPGSGLRDAVCLAVDPDLVRTVQDMSGGYRVRGPDGAEADGRGAGAAGAWLGRLRAAAAGRCVLALPFADADLVALSRAGLDDLAGYAIRDGARILAELLDTPVRTDTTWPADGLLDERSLTEYVAAGGRTLVLSSDSVATSGRSERIAAGGTVRLSAPRAARDGAPPAGPPVAVLADPLLTLAAAAPPAAGGEIGASGTRGLGSLAAVTSDTPAGTGAPLSGQDLTGAVAFRALEPTGTGTALLVAPPHRWNTTGEDARELLATINALVSIGRFSASPFAVDAVDAAGSLIYPLRAGAREVPAKVTARLRTARDSTAELRSAADTEPGVGTTPAQVFDPVTEGLLRAVSAVWRGRPDQSDAATTAIVNRVRLLRSLVRVLEPPSPYLLGGREAPLPLTLANGLPVAMRVRVALSDTPGLRTAAIPAQRIPPLGRLQLRANAQLTRSGQFSVEARLTTLAGGQLGLPSRLQLRSTAYGTITLWLTGTAGALLVILAARRIARRVRSGGPGRHSRSASKGSATPRDPTTLRDPVSPRSPADPMSRATPGPPRQPGRPPSRPARRGTAGMAPGTPRR